MSQYLSPWFTRRVRNFAAQIKVFFRLTITAGDKVQQVHKSLLDILFLLEAVTKTLLISNIIGEKRSNFHYDAPEYIFVNIGLYPLTMISSAISGKYACFTSISSACILTNTLQLHFTSTPVTAFSSIPSHLLHTPGGVSIIGNFRKLFLLANFVQNPFHMLNAKFKKCSANYIV